MAHPQGGQDRPAPVVRVVGGPEPGPAGDVLHAGGQSHRPVRDRWAALSARRRRWAAAVALVLVAAVALPVGAAEVRDRAEERRLRDTVQVTATLGATGRSSGPGGGRVDFYVTVRNDGLGRVRVDSVQLDSPRLRIRSRGENGGVAAPGATVDLPVSVLLDCTGGSAPLEGSVTARAASGRQQTVATPFAEVDRLVSGAAMLCRVRPGTVGRELSGPIVPEDADGRSGSDGV